MQWAMCCAETGYCYNAEVYEGRKQSNDIDNNGLGMSVILSKIAIMAPAEQRSFYFDNFFTSFERKKHTRNRNRKVQQNAQMSHK